MRDPRSPRKIGRNRKIALRTVFFFCESVERTSCGHHAYRKVGIKEKEAAARKMESVTLSLFMKLNNLEVEEGFSTMATLAWVEDVWLARW